MNQTPDKPKTSGEEEDFTTSMARLAELAAQGITPEKPKTASTVDEDAMREYLTPKRKAKAQKSWSQIFVGNSIKVRINPYAASGVLVVLISIGFLAAPRLAKYLEARSAQQERKQVAAAKVAAQTEDKLKNYTVFDAAKDSGGGRELKATSIGELASKMEEANIRANANAKINLLAENTTPDLTFAMASEDTGLSSSDEEMPVLIDDSQLANSLQDLGDWEAKDINSSLYSEFKWDKSCVPVGEVADSLNTEAIYSDVLKSLDVAPSDPNQSTSCRG